MSGLTILYVPAGIGGMSRANSFPDLVTGSPSAIHARDLRTRFSRVAVCKARHLDTP
jgi:hypothetical protein